MRATFPVFPLLITGLMVIPVCCSKGADLPPHMAEAMALAQKIREQTGGKEDGAAFAKMMAEPQEPKVAHRSPDTLDPNPLVVESEVILILQQQGACGDSTATAVWKVTKEKVERPQQRGNGTGGTACKVNWSAAPPGETYGAQGNFLVTVVDIPTFEMMRGITGSTPLQGAGDEAFLMMGCPYVRRGDLAVTIENTTSTNKLSIAVLKAVAARMPK